MPRVVGVTETPIVVSGEGRAIPGAGASGTSQLRFELRLDDFVVLGAGSPIGAAYRDVSTVAVDQGRVLLAIGGTRLIAERLGAGLGTLVGTLRDRRARQLLSDRFIEVPDADSIDLVEYRADSEQGVAQLAYHPWGVALLPLDERLPWRLLRRADIAAVSAEPLKGRLKVDVTPRPGAPDARPIELLGLGLAVERERARLAGLRERALADAAAIVDRLTPGTPADVRNGAGRLLVDGRPVTPAELGAAWPDVEGAVLSDPTYARSYEQLVERAGGATQPSGRWISLAPRVPGKPDEHMCWFFVALPRDLVAFELVSGGSHATYLFRAGGDLAATVYDVSESLIDSRFLREPIYLPEQELADPERQRYRFAIAALPSLRAARARFAGRLIHVDDASWSRALDEAINTRGA